MSAVDGTAAARLARKKVFLHKSHNSNRSKREGAVTQIIADSRILRIIQTFEIPS